MVTAVAIVCVFQVNCLPLVPNDYDPNQEFELRQALIAGIFNNTRNIYVIKKTFKSGTNKICIPISYNISWFDQEECNYYLTSTFESTYIWTSFDMGSSAGQLMYFFATNNYPVFGFDWSGACDIDHEISATSVPVLQISSVTLPCKNYTLIAALEYITTLVSE